jgi:hypothetical protein
MVLRDNLQEQSLGEQEDLPVNQQEVMEETEEEVDLLQEHRREEVNQGMDQEDEEVYLKEQEDQDRDLRLLLTMVLVREEDNRMEETEVDPMELDLRLLEESLKHLNNSNKLNRMKMPSLDNNNQDLPTPLLIEAVTRLDFDVSTPVLLLNYLHKCSHTSLECLPHLCQVCLSFQCQAHPNSVFETLLNHDLRSERIQRLVPSSLFLPIMTSKLFCILMKSCTNTLQTSYINTEDSHDRQIN